MKRVFGLPFLLLGVLATPRALAQNQYLCCDLASQTEIGACVASGSPCPLPDSYGIALSDVAGDGGGFPVPAGVTDASFPSGKDGQIAWTKKVPWIGFCLDAPSTEDPGHSGPTEPIGCLAVDLVSGIGAQLATAQFPMSMAWDAYQLCYGAPLKKGFAQYGADGGGEGCANVDDAFDSTVTETPISHSCCGAAELLNAPADVADGGATKWSVTVTEELPGILPPVVVVGPDGGLLVNDNPDAGDQLSGPGDAAALDGPRFTQPDSGLPPCVPTTCAAEHETCAVIPDNCGGTLSCASDCSSQARACNVVGPGADTASLGSEALLLLVGLAGARRLRR
jgi:hypothetical protein